LFRFVSKQICLFRLFQYWSETPKRTETNRKNNLLVSRNKPKNNRNRLSFGLFRFEPKFYFICFEDTLVAAPQCVPIGFRCKKWFCYMVFNLRHFIPTAKGLQLYMFNALKMTFHLKQFTILMRSIQVFLFS
jgi:hypothetical protein